ncbi:PhnD/SsuA/transferrin family substrate-binding protein [Thiosocius teredinicola]|uniref:PhnD/SsuA/transferrin family substrate-binding protein n=1 Tax=Thiosocius teredinicola TaxID=1973002 RepID=UPI0009912B3A
MITATRLLLLLFIGFLLSLPAHAAPDEIKLGVFPRRSAEVTQRFFQPLADYLTERLGVPVTLHTPADYPAFWAAIERGDYDLIHYNQYHYIRAHRQYGHLVIARNEEFGRDTLRTTIWVRRDAPFKTLAALKGQKILFGGGKSALVSYIVAVDMLREAGLQPGDYLEQFAQNPPKATIGLYYGQADAAAAGDVVTLLPSVQRQIRTEQLRVLAYGKPLPHLPWAVTPDIEPELRKKLIQALRDLNLSHEGRAVLQSMRMTGIRDAKDSDYDLIRSVVRRITGESY